METPEMARLIHYGEERTIALDLAADRLEKGLDLVPKLREQGYSMEVIAEQLGVTRQTLYNRKDGEGGKG